MMDATLNRDRGSVVLGALLMLILSVLLFWLPGIGSLIAGIVGGKLRKARGTQRARVKNAAARSAMTSWKRSTSCVTLAERRRRGTQLAPPWSNR